MTHKEKALTYFENKFNCSQAVFATFAAEMGMDEELALKIATNFGGGARNGQLCGSVSGALMVLGLTHGHYRFGDFEQKAASYALAVEFNKRFSARHGTIVCKELLGYDLTIPAQKAVIMQKNLFRTLCPQYIASAAEIVEEMLLELDNESKENKES